MSDASDFLAKWVHKNITPATAHIHNDTLTAGRLAEETAVPSEELFQRIDADARPGETRVRLSVRPQPDSQANGAPGGGAVIIATSIDGRPIT